MSADYADYADRKAERFARSVTISQCFVFTAVAVQVVLAAKLGWLLPAGHESAAAHGAHLGLKRFQPRPVGAVTSTRTAAAGRNRRAASLELPLGNPPTSATRRRRCLTAGPTG